MTTKATIAILAALAFGANAGASDWIVDLSDDHEGDEGGCWARWDASGGKTVQIVENDQTDADRAEVGLPTHRPVLRWTFAGHHGVTAPPSPDVPLAESLVDFEVRLFPDDGEGFVALERGRDITVYMQLWEREWSPLAGHWMLQWNTFPVERLRTWAVANDPQAIAEVALPEARLILKWSEEVRGSREDYEVEKYLDIPLWRTANVINKLERCSCTMRRGLGARCWVD